MTDQRLTDNQLDALNYGSWVASPAGEVLDWSTGHNFGKLGLAPLGMAADGYARWSDGFTLRYGIAMTGGVAGGWLTGAIATGIGVASLPATIIGNSAGNAIAIGVDAVPSPFFVQIIRAKISSIIGRKMVSFELAQ